MQINENGGRMFLRIFDTYLQVHVVLKPRKTTSKTKRQISIKSCTNAMPLEATKPILNYGFQEFKNDRAAS
jgi:hypothetical protein